MMAAMLEIVKLGTNDLHPYDKKGVIGSGFYIGLLLTGFLKSSYSLSLSLAQVKEGALLFMDGCRHKCGQKALDSFASGSFEKSHTLMWSLDPIAGQTICLVQLAALQDYTNSVGDLGTRAREVFEAYDAARFHARAIARSGNDGFLANYPAHTAFTLVADIPLTEESWNRWEPAMQFAANNERQFYLGHFRCLAAHLRYSIVATCLAGVSRDLGCV
jgi:hypothetical protein